MFIRKRTFLYWLEFYYKLGRVHGYMAGLPDATLQSFATKSGSPGVPKSSYSQEFLDTQRRRSADQ